MEMKILMKDVRTLWRRALYLSDAKEMQSRFASRGMKLHYCPVYWALEIFRTFFFLPAPKDLQRISKPMSSRNSASSLELELIPRW